MPANFSARPRRETHGKESAPLTGASLNIRNGYLTAAGIFTKGAALSAMTMTFTFPHALRINFNENECQVLRALRRQLFL